MDKKDIFSQALNDLKSLKDNIRKKVQDDLIKEHEEKIDKMVNKLMKEEDDDEKDEKSSSENNNPETEENKEDRNIDLIDQILNDLDLDNILNNSEVEVEVTDETPEVTSSPDNEQDQNSEETQEEEPKEEELDEFYNKQPNKKEETKNNNTPQMENNKEKIEDAGLSEDQIAEFLKELDSNEEDKLGEEKPHNPKGEETAGDWSGLDEEDNDDMDEQFLAELRSMTDEDFEDAMTTLQEEDDENSENGDTTEVPDANKTVEPEMEEGMSYASQTHKSVGGKNFPHREGKPERRSNMENLYEEIGKDIETLSKQLDELSKENKTLKEQYNALKNINSDVTKKFEKTKEKLYEVSLTSHKTASVNQLLLEYSLNQKEKQRILKELIAVDTIEQSKETFKKLNEELSNENKRVIRESIEEKITKTTVQGGASLINEKKIMIESNPMIKKWKELAAFEHKTNKHFTPTKNKK